jgi:hypothetical protein
LRLPLAGKGKARAAPGRPDWPETAGARPRSGMIGDVIADETSPQPNVVPSVCENGHTSWPGRFIRVRDQSVYTSRTGTRTGRCPECGKPRAILPGEYRAGTDGLVMRADLPALRATPRDDTAYMQGLIDRAEQIPDGEYVTRMPLIVRPKRGEDQA